MDFAAAEQEVEKALRVDPKLAGAYFVRAGLSLRTMDLEAADKAADEGLKSNPRDLELLSIKAATRFLADDRVGFEALKTRVLGHNPRYARFFLIVGEFAEWEHRYDDIVAMMREAVAIDPDEAKAYAALGLNLIRAGNEPAGLEELRKAWRRDKFNVRVYNTLDLFEKTIARDYVTVDGTTFRLRYPKADRALLERYVPRMLEQAWASMTERYRFRPPTPVGIELYADPQSFSIRTAGLPNIGIQGVCFGKTLAALGPGAGPFNWGMILWHELSHVFAIEQSKSRVPRWFTEGLSEYETLRARPEWRRRDDLALYRGLKHDKIPKLAAFNRAFTHAEEPEDLTTAYFAASQIMVFLVGEFGFEKTVSALPLWAASKRTPEVVQTAFGVSAEELDRRFRAWLAPRLERYRKQYVPDLEPPSSVDAARKALEAEPRSPAKLVKLALGMLGEGDEQPAAATLALALSIDPKHADALYLALRAAMKSNDVARSNELLRRLIGAGHDGYAVRMKAADVAELEKKPERVKAELWAAHQWDPTQSEPLQALYDLARKAKDSDGELEALRMLAQVDAHDARVWRRLLGRLVEKGQWEEARGVGESALYVAVDDPEVHRLYARSLARTGSFVSAIYELNSAIIAGAGPKDAAPIYRSMAEGYRKLGKEAYASKAEELAKQATARAVREQAAEPSDALRGRGDPDED
jgi:tetratricopeptide (TPR) repeat protein